MNRILIALVFVVTMLHVVSPAPVLACTTTPEGRPSYTLADKVSAAPIILEGTVTAVSEESHPFTATVAVLQYFKGSGPSEVTIGNFGHGAMCLTTVSVGDHLIFFAGGDPATGLRAFYMSAGAAVSPVNSESIAALRELLPQASVPAAAAPSESLIRTTLKVMLGLVISILQ